MTVGPPSGDNRSYRVNFDRIHRELPGFRCRYTAKDGARQLREVFERIQLTSGPASIPRLHPTEAAHVPAGDRTRSTTSFAGAEMQFDGARNRPGVLWSDRAHHRRARILRAHVLRAGIWRGGHARSKRCSPAFPSTPGAEPCAACTFNSRLRMRANSCAASKAPSSTCCWTCVPGSPTYLRHAAVPLNDDSRDAVFVPHGVAHGFQTLVDSTEVLYQMTDTYAPDLAAGVRWNDAGIWNSMAHSKRRCHFRTRREVPGFRSPSVRGRAVATRRRKSMNAWDDGPTAEAARHGAP